jgi:hypothetical protein
VKTPGAQDKRRDALVWVAFGWLRAMAPTNRRQGKGRVWEFLCDPELGGCGQTVERNMDSVRQQERRGCVQMCPDCVPRAMQLGLRSGTGHRSKSGCTICEGLPHRRRKPHCRGCLEPYEAEPALSIDDISDHRKAIG